MSHSTSIFVFHFLSRLYATVYLLHVFEGLQYFSSNYILLSLLNLESHCLLYFTFSIGDHCHKWYLLSDLQLPFLDFAMHKTLEL